MLCTLHISLSYYVIYYTVHSLSLHAMGCGTASEHEVLTATFTLDPGVSISSSSALSNETGVNLHGAWTGGCRTETRTSMSRSSILNVGFITLLQAAIFLLKNLLTEKPESGFPFLKKQNSNSKGKFIGWKVWHVSVEKLSDSVSKVPQSYSRKQPWIIRDLTHNFHSK